MALVSILFLSFDWNGLRVQVNGTTETSRGHINVVIRNNIDDGEKRARTSDYRNIVYKVDAYRFVFLFPASSCSIVTNFFPTDTIGVPRSVFQSHEQSKTTTTTRTQFVRSSVCYQQQDQDKKLLWCCRRRQTRRIKKRGEKVRNDQQRFCCFGLFLFF